jgi:hypothetical protein
MSFKK